MPELELCTFCGLPIDPEKDKYVKVPPPPPPETQNFGAPIYLDKYAHTKCYEAVALPLKV